MTPAQYNGLITALGGIILNNPMTTLGDMIYEDATPTPTRLPGHTANSQKFLAQTGTGTVSGVPSWKTISANDLVVMLGDSGGGGTKGAVPAPAAGDAAAGKFLKADATWAAPSGAGGVTVGAAVTGGTATRILYEAAGNVIGETANLLYDGSSITVTSAAKVVHIGGTLPVGYFTDGTMSVQLLDGTKCAQFSDGVRTVSICDGANNVSYTPAVSGNWTAAAPTDIWIALDRIVAWIAANSAALALVGVVGKP